MPLARCQAALLERVFPALLGQAPPLNRDQLRMLEEDNVGDASAAFALFGLEPTPFREGSGITWANRQLNERDSYTC